MVGDDDASSSRHPPGASAAAPRRSHAKRKRKPGEPVPPRTAYNYFFKHEQERKRAHSESGDSASSIGVKWRSLDALSRGYYEGLAVQDKRRYAIELVQWKQRQESQQASIEAEEVKEAPTVFAIEDGRTKTMEIDSYTGKPTVGDMYTATDAQGDAFVGHQRTTLRDSQTAFSSSYAQSLMMNPPLALPPLGTSGTLLQRIDQLSALRASVSRGEQVHLSPMQIHNASSIHPVPAIGIRQEQPASSPNFLLTSDQRQHQQQQPVPLPARGSLAWVSQELGPEGVDIFIRMFR